MRLKNQGEQSVAGGPKGDLYITLKVSDDERFEREGDDLHLDVHVNVKKAILGGEQEITTIDGKKINVRVPEGTDGGKVLRLRGMGMPTANGNRGDLFLKLLVKVPKNLSKKEKDEIKEIDLLDKT